MKTTPDLSFGSWLGLRRKAFDLTQGELAERVGCAVITIQKIEANERRPSKQMTRRLATPLQITEQDYPEFEAFARQGECAHHFAKYEFTSGITHWGQFSRRASNLPVPPTALIGRDKDVALACRRLLEDGIRLLTLVGPPGVGKTRLAIQIAACLLNSFEDGVFFVSLAQVQDPEAVMMTIAQTLAVNQIGEQSFTNRLKEYLRDKQMLLVLDNFEQILTAAPLIGDLLEGCPWVNVLVTSRSPLSIRGERCLPVLPLTLPDEGSVERDPQILIRFSSIELLVSRMQDVQPEFLLTNENSGVIEAICRRLDGLPLAIELAAGRVGSMPLEMLLAKYSERQILYMEGLRDLTDRHRTLYHAIDWSYALLSADEKILLTRLSVFSGGCTAEAVESVMPELPAQVSLEALRALVNHNLVMKYQKNGAPRYTLLETIRTYAKQRLIENGQEELIRQRHAEIYLSLAEQAMRYLRTSEQVTWLDRLELERPNLRFALSWFLNTTGDVNKGLRLAGALGWFWNVRCHVSEGFYWLVYALNTGENACPDLRIEALIGMGSLAFLQGNLALARTGFEECIALCRAAGTSHQPELALALGGLANVMMYQIDPQAVKRAAEESLSISEQIGDTWGIGMALLLTAEAQLLNRDYHGAVNNFIMGLSALRKTGDRWGIGSALMDLGYTYLLLGDLKRARAFLEESTALLCEIGERSVRSLTLNILAQVVQQQGDHQQASMLYRECLDLLNKAGIEASIADVQYNLANFVQAHGNYSLAQRLYCQSLELFSERGDEQGIARCQAGLAEVMV